VGVVAAHGVALALGQQPAAPHDPDVGADLLDLGEEVGGDEHGGALVGQFADEVADLARPLRVQAVRGLVEHEQLAGPQQRRGQAEALLHAERVLPVRLGRRGDQAHPFERRGDARPGGGRIGGGVAGVQPAEVVPAAEVGVERGPLHQGTHPRQHGGPLLRHGVVQQPRPSCGGAHEPQQHPDGRRLARAVRAEEPVDGAPGNLQVDPVDRDLTGAEPLGQSLGADRRGAHAIARSVSAGTAPTRMRPSSVTSTLSRAELSSRPSGTATVSSS